LRKDTGEHGLQELDTWEARLAGERRRWLVTGAAGFIGSHLIDALLAHGQEVVALDDFSTGHRANLERVRVAVGAAAWSRCTVIEGDIRDFDVCRDAARDADVILHHAALSSVPASLADPRRANAVNVAGFINVMSAARECGVGRVVYASSSAVYGDDEQLPKQERCVGAPLSPYAADKHANELYAAAFSSCYGTESVGLRYFNVFGPRQDPNGAYAAVIPRWIDAMVSGKAVTIFGDGNSTRDFCYVANVVQANILAATASGGVVGKVCNIACGRQSSLLELYGVLKALLTGYGVIDRVGDPVFEPYRAGDVRHSHADVSLAAQMLGYAPTHDLEAGLRETVPWFVAQAAHQRVSALEAKKEPRPEMSAGAR
jgi:UDP-N-acetylglucosamine 4-epimerase